MAVQVPTGRPDRPGLEDERAIGAAYAAHGAELYRFALRGLADPGAAEDVVQETFLRAWRAADRFDPSRASLRVWLFAIARNAVRDHARAARARPWQQQLDPAGQNAEVADVMADASEQVLGDWMVEDALRRLSDDHRTAIVATVLEDRPYAEVAAALQVPVGTVRSRVFYGLKALRVTMDELGMTP